MVFDFSESSMLRFAVVLTLLVAFASSEHIRQLSNTKNKDVDYLRDSLREIPAKDIASFLDYQTEVELSKRRRRGLNLVDDFGGRCGNHNTCAGGMECTELQFGNRCLPNSCLEETVSEALEDTFDEKSYKETLYKAAGYSEDEVIAALVDAGNERTFLKTKEWQALQAAFHQNLEPLRKVQEISERCINPFKPYQNDTAAPVEGTVSYLGLHIEVGALIDFSINYIVATNGDDQTAYLRCCYGAEAGVGAEISFLFGFTDTPLSQNMLCASVFADADIVLLVAAGVSILCGFNGVFSYEFTIGGGLGLGIGGGFCAAFEQANSTGISDGLAPSIAPSSPAP